MFDDRPLYHDDESPHIREISMGTSGDIKRCGCFSCLTNVNTVCYGQCILHTLTIVQPPRKIVVFPTSKKKYCTWQSRHR